jgi:hypothetical protein
LLFPPNRSHTLTEWWAIVVSAFFSTVRHLPHANHHTESGGVGRGAHVAVVVNQLQSLLRSSIKLIPTPCSSVSPISSAPRCDQKTPPSAAAIDTLPPAYCPRGILGFRREDWGNPRVRFAYQACSISRWRSRLTRNSRSSWTALLHP